MIRVFLADDHPILLSGLARVIGEAGDMAVVGTASDGRQVLLATDLAWDVLVLDLSLPRVGGAEVLRRVRERYPERKVVILSMYPEDQYALRMMRAGAAAYLSKDRPPEELLQAIRQVAAGGAYLSGALASQLVKAPERIEQPPHTRLSAREHQVFVLLVNGRTVSEIAAELDLSVSTVSTHVHHIKDKLGVRTIAEVVSYAHRADLID